MLGPMAVRIVLPPGPTCTLKSWGSLGEGGEPSDGEEARE